MAGIVGKTAKKLLQIDVNFDTICPWCFVGKRSLDKAILLSKAQFDFEVRWHPFFTYPLAGTGGISKNSYFQERFGSVQDFLSQISPVFVKELGLEFSMAGQSGYSFDSHRLVYFAGLQGFDKQHTFVENLFVGHFADGKSINDWKFLISAATNAGVEGAQAILKNPDLGTNEVMGEFVEHSSTTAGVPLFKVKSADKQWAKKFSGVQPIEVFVREFQFAGRPKRSKPIKEK